MTLQFRRGPSAQAPSTAALGEPIYVTDTGILYIGSGSGLQKIGPVTAADLEGLDFTPVQSIDDVPGLTAALAGKSDVGHTHDYSELTGTPDIGATALTDLTDWPSGAPSQDQILKFDGNQWVFAADLTGDANSGGDAQTLNQQPGSHYLNRANHTGTQTAETISDFSAAVAAAAPAAPVDSVAGKTGDVTLTKADVGLGNVNNTSDAEKPVSTQTQAELDLKADISSLSQVATSGSYTHLIDKPTIPSSFTDLLPVPVDTDASATIVWSVANQQWEISQDGAPPVVDGFEFRGFVYDQEAPDNLSGFDAAGISVVSNFVSDDDNVFPFTAPDYDPRVDVTFSHSESGGRWMFFAYRWTGDQSAPSWSPTFYKPGFPAAATPVSHGTHVLDLGNGSQTYFVFQLGSSPIPDLPFTESYEVE